MCVIDKLDGTKMPHQEDLSLRCGQNQTTQNENMKKLEALS